MSGSWTVAVDPWRSPRFASNTLTALLIPGLNAGCLRDIKIVTASVVVFDARHDRDRSVEGVPGERRPPWKVISSCASPGNAPIRPKTGREGRGSGDDRRSLQWRSRFWRAWVHAER